MGKGRAKRLAAAKKLDVALGEQGKDIEDPHRKARQELMRTMNDNLTALGE